MKRIQPLLLIVVCAVLVVVGVVWKIFDADDCIEQRGTVVAPMTRGQHCVEQ